MIKNYFTDLGGVLLTNGWDRKGRRLAAERFALDMEDTDERHHLTFDTYEIGRLNLEEYLRRTVFHTRRDFAYEQFTAFMYDQSQPLQDMIDLVRGLKEKHGFRLHAISNEGAELASYRINTFHLDEYIDSFFISGFLNMRKPDAQIFQTALCATQATVEESVYVDDRKLFVEIASGLGMQAIHHTSTETTRAELARLGLEL